MTRAYTPALNPAGASPREVSERVNKLLQGKFNSVGTLTLAENSATTVLLNENIGLESGIFLSPMTANAKAEGSPWFQVTAKGEITLNHANNAQTDRTYFYMIAG